MTTNSLTQITTPKPSFTAISTGLLQRKCACGNSAGLTGECAACQREKLALQRKKTATQKDVSEVPLIMHEMQPLAQQAQKLSSFNLIANDLFKPTKQLPPGEEEVGEDYLDRFLEDELATKKFQMTPALKQDTTDPPGVKREPGYIRAGSGTCSNGGGSSNCNQSTGVYEILSNDNTCCTKDCTQRHEMQHVIDHTAWGCCKKFSQDLRDNADRNAVRRAYSRWFDIVAPITECHASRSDVKCIEEMEKAQKCKSQGAKSDCCVDIADYKARYSSLAKEYCDKAPAKAPPCPLVLPS